VIATTTSGFAPGALDADAIAAAALASLRSATPSRLHRLFTHFGGPAGALAAVRAGRASPALAAEPNGDAIARRWARDVDPDRVESQLRERGARVFAAGRPGFPIDLELRDAPAVLFAEGDRPEVLDRPRVAVIGTRAATPGGLADAHAIGRFLAEQGVTVVSGLALGVDGAAHRGALEVGGGAIGVVATGLEADYPRRHKALFDGVRRHGLLVGEHGFGVPPSRSRFPIRNRIIAALSDAVVVVEATATGGSRYTVDWAIEYHREVFAVPGSRRNPAAELCNTLIRDGAHPLLHPSDVVLALAQDAPASSGYAAIAADLGGDGGWDRPAVVLSPPARRLFRTMGGDPATLDQLVALTGATVGETAGLVRELERAGRVQRAHGRFWPC
jgi:DNA processing protein